MLVVSILNGVCQSTLAAAPLDFEKQIRPIFQMHCVGCHGATMQEGGLRLDAKSLAMRGGDSGAVLTPGKSASSELFRRVSSSDDSERMPPKGNRLSAEQLELLQRWIDEGAAWPETEADRAAARDPRLDHWAWQPIKQPQLPANPPGNWARTEIDRFVLAKLQEKSLQPSAEANPQTLIRRLYFDLIGLPPTPDEIDQFVRECESETKIAPSATTNREPSADPKANASPSAYERLVERLLRSPRYGERWARHWLDVVHYGDTHGYDKDKLRPNAWPYRDYVIRALNSDKPYARFVEEQIAGDVLYPESRDGIEALGFIAAGPWDFIGHAEVPESKIDGKVARHLDRDDMVGNTLGTFCSITIQCAQCHNHKFDPFTQEDYYSLQAVFAALDRADRKYFADAEQTRRFNQLEQQQRGLIDRQKSLQAKARQAAGATLTALESKIEAASKNIQGNTRSEFGYHSAVSPKQDVTKWVQVDLGSSVVIDRVVLLPCYDNFNKIGAGFGFPVRYRVEVCDEPKFEQNPQLIVGRFKEDVPNPKTVPQSFSANGASGRYVRITATKLAPRQNDFILALAELQVFDTAGKNVAEGAAVTALDSIESPPRWRKANLVDQIAPPSGNTGDLAKLQAERDALLKKSADEATVRDLESIQTALAKIGSELKSFPAPSVVYAGTVHYGTGAFAGTGPMGGKPRKISILSRGNVLHPLREVQAGAIAAFDSLPGRFDLPADHAEGLRRAALAKWLTNERNPLTWRSIVNRVWQYHFGRGIVDTSNDFGRMGAAPTHPELLDWLAADFRDHGGSLKRLHWQIVTSATYRQQSDGSRDAARDTATPQPKNRAQEIDADNRFLWRQNRRKLEAEAVRDAVLAVSGKLDLTMEGPGYQDFVIEHPAHSPHYEYHLADPNDPKTWRRSVYRFIVRSQTQPFMTSLDCADPSMRVEKRNESVSALQALALLNNGFMVTQANHFAERLVRETGNEPAQQITRAYRLAVGRTPTETETAALTPFVRENGLPNLCRVLMNLNEFVFVD